jgi:hypothetical protein
MNRIVRQGLYFRAEGNIEILRSNRYLLRIS